MEYQKITNMLDNTSNQPYNFKIENCVEINDESWETDYKYNQGKFKTSMLRSSLCDYSHAYILVKVTITVQNKAARDQPNMTVFGNM